MKYIFILLAVCLSIAIVSWVSSEWIFVMGTLCLIDFHFVTMQDSEKAWKDDVTIGLYIVVMFFYAVLVAIIGYVHILLFLIAYELWYFFLQIYGFEWKWAVGETSLIAAGFSMVIYFIWIGIFA